MEIKPLSSSAKQCPDIHGQQEVELEFSCAVVVGIMIALFVAGDSRDVVRKWEAGGCNQAESTTLIGGEGPSRELKGSYYDTKILVHIYSPHIYTLLGIQLNMFLGMFVLPLVFFFLSGSSTLILIITIGRCRRRSPRGPRWKAVVISRADSYTTIHNSLMLQYPSLLIHNTRNQAVGPLAQEPIKTCRENLAVRYVRTLKCKHTEIKG